MLNLELAKKAARTILIWSISSSALAGDLPIPSQTSGDINPVLTKSVLCAPHFSTRLYRNVPSELKNDVYASYGLTRGKLPCPCEVDHLIPLEVGGSNDITNLWPQSYVTTPLNAHVKDCLEDKLHKLVCSGQVPLKEAQDAISSNWIDAYHKYMAMPVSGKVFSHLYENNCKGIIQ